MLQVAAIDSNIVYSGNERAVKWEGVVFGNRNKFQEYLREVVRPRLEDSDSSFEKELNNLRMDGMNTTYLGRLLSSIPSHLPWEIGEALAECLLQDDSGREVIWPWNNRRDRKTPMASLPGADLVGFCGENGKTLFLFGQVKTSSDASTPPSVMNGKKGLRNQIKELAFCVDVQRSLLEWLHARCRRQPFRDLYEDARSLYLGSGGQETFLVGILIRDTAPDERDLKAAGISLSALTDIPARIELHGWYFPVPLQEWSSNL